MIRELLSMQCRQALYRSLDRPVFRHLLVAGGTAYGCVKTRGICRVHYDGMWVQEYPEGVLVEPRLLFLTLSQLEESTRDIFMYQYVPKAGDVIFDVGAASGWETLVFARHVGTAGRVISIEANPRVYSCLQRMCCRNKLDNVILLNCAAAGSEGIIHISDRELFISNTIFGADADVPVRGRTLDEIVDTLHLGRVDLLKMNIEGAEGIAIKGMAKMIRNTRYVCICCHDFLAAERSNEAFRTKSSVITFLEQNNFAVSLRESDWRPCVSNCVYGRNRGADG